MVIVIGVMQATEHLHRSFSSSAARIGSVRAVRMQNEYTDRSLGRCTLLYINAPYGRISATVKRMRCGYVMSSAWCVCSWMLAAAATATLTRMRFRQRRSPRRHRSAHRPSLSANAVSRPQIETETSSRQDGNAAAARRGGCSSGDVPAVCAEIRGSEQPARRRQERRRRR